MTTVMGQLARIFLFLAVLTAMAALSAVPGRSAPFAAHVMDARTGETLIADNADTRLHPASLTKMLTLYIAFDAIRRGEIGLDTMVTVSANAASKPPSRLGLRAGQKIALRHLIRAAAVKSANDAASAIGDALSGNEAAFARRMDRTAKAIGMKNSTFRNANGLTAPGHLSTARDMSVLGRRLFYDFPEYYNIFSRQTADAGVAQVANTNNRFLSSYRGADGIKTGYTVAAGFNLTASAERDGKRLIATVFGGTSTAQRNARISQLLDAGFAAAPGNVATRKPAPVTIPPPERTPDIVASADPAPADPRASAKTIRLVTSMAKSPRPRARPAMPDAAAAAMVVASLQSSIADAVAAAEAPPPFQVVEAPPPAAVPAPVAAPDVARAAPEAEPLPFALVEADSVTPPGTTPAATETAPAFASPQPRPRPSGLAAPRPVEVAEAPPAAVEAEALAEEIALAEAPAAPSPALPDEDIGEAFDLAESEGEPDPAPPTAIAQLSAPAATALAPLGQPLPAMPAPPRVAALRPAPAPGADLPAAEPVVVTRISTSGGRHWGVTLGRFPSRAAAERALMRTALSEGAALGDGLRKIAPAAKGFDANVLGLSEAQADLACRRLQARAQTCRILSP